jgi:Ca2+-binding RTX toxin-like protein
VTSLQAVGTNGSDFILVTEPNGTLVVQASFLSEGSRSFSPNVDQIQVFGLGGDDTLIVGGNVNKPAILDGGEGNDTINGGNENDTMIGGAGDDRLSGGGGDDTLIGGPGNDVMNGGAGTDTADYSAEKSAIVVNLQTNIGIATGASIGNDSLANIENVIGGSGNDTIVGSSGSNRIDGGGGADSLTGMRGDDVFIFRAAQANGDVVVDFDAYGSRGAPEHDVLQFSGFGTAAQGATFTEIGSSNQWQIHSGLDGHNEIITFSNNAHLLQSDYSFL